MPVFEYKVLTLWVDEVEATLNKWGVEGWLISSPLHTQPLERTDEDGYGRYTDTEVTLLLVRKLRD